MQVYRITKQKYAKDISGRGAELYGGRWNPIGIPALYTSENRALCALELLVHTPKEMLPPSYSILSLDIPKSLVNQIITLHVNKLGKGWDSLQPENWSMEIGKKYFQDLNAFGIRVPSTIIKEENNIILNPLHEKFQDIKIISISEFKIDQRLLK